VEEIEEDLVFDTGFGVLTKDGKQVSDDAVWVQDGTSVVADGASSHEESRFISEGVVRAVKNRVPKLLRSGYRFPQAVVEGLSQERKEMLRNVRDKRSNKKQLSAAFIATHLKEEDTQRRIDVAYSGDCEAFLISEHDVNSIADPIDFAHHLRSSAGISTEEVETLRELFEDAEKHPDGVSFFYQECQGRLGEDFWQHLTTYYSRHYNQNFSLQRTMDHVWNKRSTTYGMYAPLDEEGSRIYAESVECPEDSIALLVASDGLRLALRKNGSSMEELIVQIRNWIKQRYPAQLIVDEILNALNVIPDDVALSLTVLLQEENLIIET
jgi:serine/threonine protein phosphatase PrpC